MNRLIKYHSSCGFLLAMLLCTACAEPSASTASTTFPPTSTPPAISGGTTSPTTPWDIVWDTPFETLEAHQDTPRDAVELCFDAIDVSEKVGSVGCNLIYESDERIIFYEGYGVFLYDLKAQEMLFSMDFRKVYGYLPRIQGDSGVVAYATTDGTGLVIYNYDSPAHLAYYVNLSKMTYHKGPYVQPEDVLVWWENGAITGFVMSAEEIGSCRYYPDPDNLEIQYDLFAQYRTS